MLNKTGHIVYKTARLIVISVVGGSVLLIGCVMIFTPGPGVLGIAAGLGILGLEFAWARRWLIEVKRRSDQAIHDIKDDQSRLGRNWRRFKNFNQRLWQRCCSLFKRSQQ